MAAPDEGTDNGGSNGRVTLAIVGTKLDMLTEKVSEIYDMWRADHDKLNVICTKFEDIDTLKKALIGEVVGIIIAAALAIIALVGI
jgi:hypothetical protein